MNNFKYSLETVLDHRRRTEKDIQTKVARLSGAYHSHQEKLENQLENYRTLLEDADRKKTTCIQELKHLYHHQEFLACSLQEQKQRTEDARIQMERERVNLVQARMDTRILDRHREGKYQSFCRALDRKEQNQMDELATIRYSHRRRGE